MKKLGPRDRIILAAVWRAWAAYRPAPTLRELCDIAGYSMRGLCGSPNGGLYTRVLRLQLAGWLSRPDLRVARQLASGPRFAGLDDGTPLRVIG